MNTFTIKPTDTIGWINGTEGDILIAKLDDLEFGNTGAFRGVSIVMVGDTPIICVVDVMIERGSIEGLVTCTPLPVSTKVMLNITPEEAVKYISTRSWTGTPILEEFRSVGLTEKDLFLVINFFSRRVLSCREQSFDKLTDVHEQLSA